VQMTKAANGDDTMKRMTHRSMLYDSYGDDTANLRSTLKGAYGEGMVAETARKIRARILQDITTSDPACAALGCEPAGGKCEKDKNGERYCKWDSLCGPCPSGATCKTYESDPPYPYCSCPSGYGMTATSCVQGGAPTVSSYSYTYIANETAKDAAARPWTFRLNLNVCTPTPPAVTGVITSAYKTENIGDAPPCRKIIYYKSNACEGAIEKEVSTNNDMQFITAAIV
ncbi:unnamed protein product, partial [Closterium sp. Naga37s-1]